MEQQKIKNFTDLFVWQKGHKLVLNIYKITDKFPKEEKYGLSDQIKRASVSITSNIAEGFGRDGLNDKAHFYTIALGSVYEIQNQLIIARDLKYINTNECSVLLDECVEISKMISVLIKKIRSFKT